MLSKVRILNFTFAILAVAIVSTSSGQSEKRVYFDGNWKVVSSSDKYEYYRVVKLDSYGDPMGRIITYYANGSIQWMGQFTSKNVECSTCEKCGCFSTCTWYHKNGMIKREAYYKDGREVGDVKHWDENGEDISVIANNLSSEVVIKTLIDDHIKKSKYQDLEGIWYGTEEIDFFLGKKLMPIDPKPRRYGIIMIEGAYQVLEVDQGMSDLEITSIGQNGEFIVGTNSNGLSNAVFNGVGKFIDSQNVRIVMEGNRNAVTILLGKQYEELADEAKVFREIHIQKKYPKVDDIEKIIKEEIKNAPKTGTGFALSTNGLIATNFHVIEHARSIKVKGIKGDFLKVFNAKVIKSEQTTDLAIIQIDDPNFSDLGKIPYSLFSLHAEVGEDVFVLGYPLTKTMGEEIKLTTGIISANSGYQGNQNQYQISVPIQPGNSGGPLFDKNGKVVGAVNAKHSNTDNVSYAVKAQNLLELLKLVSQKPVIDTNLLAGKTLPEKVRMARNFIYIIEVNK